MNKSKFPFIALCIAAPAVQLLELYGLYHWEDGVVVRLLITGLFLMCALFAGSILSVRHHPVRAIAGALICAYCLWQSFQNAQILY